MRGSFCYGSGMVFSERFPWTVVLLVGCGAGTPPIAQPDEPPPRPTDESTGGPRPECGAPRPVDGDEVPQSERGFRPIRPSEAAAFVGKSVFAATNEGPGDRVLIVAGEPVTLCDAPSEGDAPTAAVMNNAGQEVTVPLSRVSSSPLRFNLRRPGSASTLLESVLSEADALGRLLRELDPKADALHVDGARAALANASDIARHLVTGGETEESLRERDGWVASAEDPSIMAWYVGGIPDPAVRERFEGVEACLARLADVSITPAPSCLPRP
jgi:hypothetical protein